MNLIKSTTLVAILIASSVQLRAQEVSFKLGGGTKPKLEKQSELNNFSVGGNSYFVTSNMELGAMTYYVESYTSSGSAGMQTKIDIPVGSMKDAFGLEGILGLGDQAYALVGNLNKASGKYTLTIRSIDNSGKVGTTETELMAMSYEKMMNAGFYNYSVSPDQNTLLISGLKPFEKGQTAKLKLTLFDKALKSTGSTDIELPGEDSKNKALSVHVANDGSVYVIKRSSDKIGEIVLQAYHVDMATGKLHEFALELTAPSYINSYHTAFSDKNELIIAGTYYNRQKVTVGEPKTNGIFCFIHKNQQDKLMTNFPLDAPVENLTARKVLVNGNTIYIAAEQFKEERVSPPSGSTSAFDYQYNFTHKNLYVIGIDSDGKRKFELNMPRNLSARNVNHHCVSAYFISNGKFNMVYNDERSKFTKNAGHASLIPYVVQISNDGLMTPGVAMIEKNKLPMEYILHTAKYIPTADGQINFLMNNSDENKLVMLYIK